MILADDWHIYLLDFDDTRELAELLRWAKKKNLKSIGRTFMGALEKEELTPADMAGFTAPKPKKEIGANWPKCEHHPEQNMKPSKKKANLYYCTIPGCPGRYNEWGFFDAKKIQE